MLLVGITLVFLFTLLLLLKKGKQPQDSFLILWYGFFGLQILSFYLSRNHSSSFTFLSWIIYLRFPILLLYGPLYFFYFKALKQKKLKPVSLLLHSLPSLAFSLYLVIKISGNRDLFILQAMDELLYEDPVYIGSKIFFFVSFPVYMAVSKPCFNPRKWEGIFTLAAMVLFLSSLLLGLQWNLDLLYFSMSIILSALIIAGLKIPHVIHHKTELKKSLPGKGLPEGQELKQQMTQLESYMKKHSPYLNKELTFQSLSEECGIPQYLLSHILNKGFRRNFFDFINQYRAEEFLQLYQRRDPGETIPQLAEQAGFASKPTFYRAFKSIYGSSPREYTRNILK